MHNRSQASLVVCQLRNAEWKKQEKSVIMMIPTLQLKPRLTTVHSLLLIVIRPWKFNYGNPFQQCLNVWRSPLFRHELVCGFNKSCAYTFSKSASLKTLQCVRHWQLHLSPTPPSLTSETPHTHSLFASHEITFFCSSLMYKEVMFTLLHFCRKSECELPGHQKPDRQNPSRMYDQALRDIPMCWSSIYPARTCCGVSVYRRSFDFSKPKTKV